MVEEMKRMGEKWKSEDSGWRQVDNSELGWKDTNTWAIPTPTQDC